MSSVSLFALFDSNFSVGDVYGSTHPPDCRTSFLTVTGRNFLSSAETQVFTCLSFWRPIVNKTSDLDVFTRLKLVF